MNPLGVLGGVVEDARSLAGLGLGLPRAVADLIALAGRFAALGEAILELGERLDTRAAAILELGERIDERATALLVLGERIDRRGEALDALGELIDVRGEAIVALGDQLGARGEAILELGGALLDVGREMLPEARLVHERAAELITHADQLVAVLPMLEHAVNIATPLEGAVDRLGRIVDRLPGDSRRRRPPTP